MSDNAVISFFPVSQSPILCLLLSSRDLEQMQNEHFLKMAFEDKNEN